MSNRLTGLFSKNKLITGILVGTAAISVIIPTVVFAATSAGNYTFDNANDGLRIDGSTTVFPIVSAATGTNIGSGGTAGGPSSNGPFQNSGHPMQVEVYQGGSSVGKADAQNQVVDLGDASSLSGVGSTYPNLVANKIARDGICAVVNKNGLSLTDVTPNQLKQIYNAYYAVGGMNADGSLPSGSTIQLNDGSNGSGITTDYKKAAVTSATSGAVQVGSTWMLPPITTWNQVNSSLPSVAIKPVARIIGSGTRDASGDLLGLDMTNSEMATVAHSGINRIDANADVATYLENNQYSLGYVGIGYAAEMPTATTTVLSLNGIKATPQNVTLSDLAANSAKAYPLSRYLYILQNNNPTDTIVQNNLNNANAFLTYIKSAAGQTIVEQQSFIRLVPLTDVNQDGQINVSDLGKLGQKWTFATTAYQTAHPTGHFAGTLTAGDPADINGDGVVNVSDLGKLGQWWLIKYGATGALTPDYP